MLAKGAHPRDAQLAGRAALLRSDGLQCFDESEVLLDVLLTKARKAATVVVLRQVVDALDLPGQETTTEGPALRDT